MLALPFLRSSSFLRFSFRKSVRLNGGVTKVSVYTELHNILFNFCSHEQNTGFQKCCGRENSHRGHIRTEKLVIDRRLALVLDELLKVGRKPGIHFAL